MASAKDRKDADPTVASTADNAKLEHSDGGVTTRDDVTDLGVPMLQGSSSEPVGPEDALGVGPKRGDYSGRVGPESYHPHEVRPAAADAVADPARSSVLVEAQRPRAEDRGEVAGKKGGVDTAAAS